VGRTTADLQPGVQVIAVLQATQEVQAIADPPAAVAPVQATVVLPGAAARVQAIVVLPEAAAPAQAAVPVLQGAGQATAAVPVLQEAAAPEDPDQLAVVVQEVPDPHRVPEDNKTLQEIC
jgi:hypothetical protein